MKTTSHLFYSLSLFICLAFVAGIAVPAAWAASAQKAPVAQKAPEAKKQPAAQPKPKASAKVAPRQDSSRQTKGEASSSKQKAQASSAKQKQTPAASAAPQAADDKVKHSLDSFAKGCIADMNKQRRPGVGQKEVKKQPDGTYMARYMAVDPDSLETSYNPTENNRTIKYIGRMNYHEVEYISTGKDQRQALAGPFNETNRTPIIELVKYKAGKWTY